MRPIRWILTLIFGIVLGVVLTVGGTALAGYLLVFNTKMATIEDKVLKDIPDFDLSDELRDMTLLDYGKNAYEQLKNIKTAPISNIQSALGYDIAGKLASAFGIDEQIIKDSTFPDLPENIVNQIKVRSLNENFGVEFPDFPLFKDEAFLDSPLTTAFSGLGDETLDKFIVVVYDDNTDPDKTPSSKFIQKLGGVNISKLSEDLDGILSTTTISEIMTITEDAEPIIKALKDVKLNFTDLNNAISGFVVSDVFRDYESGVLGLISPDTNLKDVPVMLSTAITSSSIYRLVQSGVYSVNLDSVSPEVKAKVYNLSPNGLVVEYALIAANPSDAALITAPRTHLINGTITQAVIDGIAGFRNGDTLVLTGDAVIPADTVFTSVFNIETDSYDLTIGDGVVIDNEGGYMYIRGYTGTSTITSLRVIKQLPTGIVDAVLVEFI